MKRLTVWVLVMLVAFTSQGAWADDFTLHAGVMFGDSIDEIKQKESEEPFE